MPTPSFVPMRPITYRKPTEGRDYWIVDNALADPDSVRARCLAKTDWEHGHPVTNEVWPGMRTTPALLDDELTPLDALVCRLTGAKRVWAEHPETGKLNHNCVQMVGADEGSVKPHTDALNLCRYAAVLYLNPSVPDSCGTSFFRQRMPNGQLGGNIVMPPHRNLVEALGTRFVPPGALIEDVRIPHRYNRLLLYKANLIHSASAYWGTTTEDRRLTAVFFWMAA